MNEEFRLKLDKDYIVIDSLIDTNTCYAVDRKKQGVSVITGKQILTIKLSLAKKFIDEYLKIIELYGG